MLHGIRANHYRPIIIDRPGGFSAPPSRKPLGRKRTRKPASIPECGRWSKRGSELEHDLVEYYVWRAAARMTRRCQFNPDWKCE